MKAISACAAILGMSYFAISALSLGGILDFYGSENDCNRTTMYAAQVANTPQGSEAMKQVDVVCSRYARKAGAVSRLLSN